MSAPDAPDPAPHLADVIRDVIAPMVARDHGEIEWLGLRDGVAEIVLRGACLGCPGQSYTANVVVLDALRAVDPSVTGVRVKVAL